MFAFDHANSTGTGHAFPTTYGPMMQGMHPVALTPTVSIQRIHMCLSWSASVRSAALGVNVYDDERSYGEINLPTYA